MCDYSLYGIENRLAEEGEVLEVHRFYSGSKGLTSPEYLKPAEPPKGWMAILKRTLADQSRVCAVCIPDGAQLRLGGISRALQQAHALCAVEAVTFRQRSASAGTYRDAVEFKNGVKVRQDLEEGQNVEVLSLSSERAGVWGGSFPTTPGLAHRIPDMDDNGVATPEELGNFYSDNGPGIRSLIQRGFPC